MSHEPIISVVLPVRGRPELLRAAVASVLDQSFAKWELIVVDDGSEPPAAEALQSVTDPRLSIHRLSSSQGAPAARNEGLRLARGEWIAFQDSDDRWTQEKLQLQWDALQESSAEALFCAYERTFLDGRKVRVPAKGRGPQDTRLLPALLRGNFIGTPTLIARRDTLIELGGFDETLPRFQDWDLAIRLAQVSEIGYVDRVLVHASTTNDGISGGHNRSLFEAERQIVIKHESSIRAEGTSLLAERYWHLGHLARMCEDGPEAQLWFGRARATQPRLKFTLSQWLARSGTLYKGCYAVLRHFV